MSLNDDEHDNGWGRGCILICLGLVIGVVLGAFLGAFLPSFLQYEYYVHFKPDILNDGQFGMLFLNTIAIGGISGGLLGGLFGGISGYLIVR